MLHLAPTKTPKQTLLAIPEGEAGIAATLRIMGALVKRGKLAPQIRQKALQLVAHLPQKDWAGQVKALHAFVRDSIRYVKDINGVETVHDPVTLLRIGQGDCDDKSTLLAALLESIGHPTRFMAVGFMPGRFSHVFTETKIGSRWVPLETTEPWEVGRAPPGIVTRKIHNN